jgi:hypothetical protein
MQALLSVHQGMKLHGHQVQLVGSCTLQWGALLRESPIKSGTARMDLSPSGKLLALADGVVITLMDLASGMVVRSMQVRLVLKDSTFQGKAVLKLTTCKVSW